MFVHAVPRGRRRLLVLQSPINGETTARDVPILAARQSRYAVDLPALVESCRLARKPLQSPRARQPWRNSGLMQENHSPPQPRKTGPTPNTSLPCLQKAFSIPATNTLAGAWYLSKNSLKRYARTCGQPASLRNRRDYNAGHGCNVLKEWEHGSRHHQQRRLPRSNQFPRHQKLRAHGDASLRPLPPHFPAEVKNLLVRPRDILNCASRVLILESLDCETPLRLRGPARLFASQICCPCRLSI